jgi:hypothetical protein
MIRLVQIKAKNGVRRVAVVEEPRLRVLAKYESTYDLAMDAAAANSSLSDLIERTGFEQELDYTPVYDGSSSWNLLPPFEHPSEPARCLVTGTGLTHKASAENRQAMHAAAAAAKGLKEVPLTDSMRMYRWGLEGGKPKEGEIGVSPEWFYKGCGTILRAHGEAMEVPAFASDGGEEPEVAGVYIIAARGEVRRVGLVLANEFSDHEFEEKNYLYLAHSKLRTCSIGPELVVGAEFQDARGKVRIIRGTSVFWQQQFVTGEKNMSHTVANLEHHHFKYPAHRRPGDAHVYFFGADAFSFGEGVRLQDGDVMEIELEGFGRPLRNPLHVDNSKPELVRVRPL